MGEQTTPSPEQQVSFTVEQLVAVNPYNPDILPDLESYVNEQTGKFSQFWDEASKNRHILEVVPGFEHAIRASAVHALSLTYQKVPRSVIAEAINLEGLSLDKFLEHHVANSGWALEKGHGKGQLIVLPRNEFNHPELKKSTDDGIPLDHVARIFPILG